MLDNFWNFQTMMRHHDSFGMGYVVIKTRFSSVRGRMTVSMSGYQGEISTIDEVDTRVEMAMMGHVETSSNWYNIFFVGNNLPVQAPWDEALLNS